MKTLFKFMSGLISACVLGLWIIYVAVATGIDGFPADWQENLYFLVGILALLGLAVAVPALAFKRGKLAFGLFIFAGAFAVFQLVYGGWYIPAREAEKSRKNTIAYRQQLYNDADHLLNCADGYNVVFIEGPIVYKEGMHRSLYLLPPGRDASPVKLLSRTIGKDILVLSKKRTL